MQVFNIFFLEQKLPDSIGARIKYIRKELNLTQQDLANRLGLKSKVSVSDFENDKRTPSIEEFIILSRISRRTIDWIVTGDDKYDSAIMKQLREREKEIEEIKQATYQLLDNAEKFKQVAEKKINYKSKSS